MSRMREQAERYIALAKSGDKPSSAAKARVSKRLAASLGQNLSPDMASTSGSATVRAAVSSSVAAIGGAALLIALLIGKVATHESHPTHRAFAKQPRATTEAQISETRAEELAPRAVEPQLNQKHAPTPSRTINRAPREPSETAMRSSLREERELLMRARSALGRADATSAAAALDDHARRFPRGELREEREALRVHWVTIERGAEAGERALRSFEDRFPRSVFTDVLRVALNRHAIASGE